VEKVRIETRSDFDLARLRDEAGAVGHLARRLAEVRSDDAAISELATILAELDKRLPAELHEGEEPLSLVDPESLRRLVGEVEAELLPRLVEGREG